MAHPFVATGVLRLELDEPRGGGADRVLERVEQRLRHRRYQHVRRYPDRVRFHALARDRSPNMRFFAAALRVGRAEIAAEPAGDDVVVRWSWDFSTLVAVLGIALIVFLGVWTWIVVRVGRLDLLMVPFALFAVALALNVALDRVAMRRLVEELARSTPAGRAPRRPRRP